MYMPFAGDLYNHITISNKSQRVKRTNQPKTFWAQFFQAIRQGNLSGKLNWNS